MYECAEKREATYLMILKVYRTVGSDWPPDDSGRLAKCSVERSSTETVVVTADPGIWTSIVPCIHT